MKFTFQEASHCLIFTDPVWLGLSYNHLNCKQFLTDPV